jgi:hypothetical protein
MKFTLRFRPALPAPPGPRAICTLCVLGVLCGDAPQAQKAVAPRNATIRGRVTAADTGAPLRGAEVRLFEGGYKLTTTNGDGLFELRDVAAGSYRLTVARAGFITLQFGQRRPFDTPTTIKVIDGANITANVALLRGGAIYGRVLDRFGEPATGARVEAFRSRMTQGRRALVAVGLSDQADDTGAFRLYGLPPGDYFVAANVGAVQGLNRAPPVYYPGTPSLTQAQAITLGTGAEAAADIQVVPARTARVSGIVLGSSGEPVPARVGLLSEAVSTAPGPGMFQLGADADATGRFSVENVPPGSYTLTATNFPGLRIVSSSPSGLAVRSDGVIRGPEGVSIPLVVADDDISDLTLVTRPGGVLVGRFVPDAGVVQPLPAGLRISIASGPASGRTHDAATVQSDFKIELMGGGPYRFQVEGVPEGWAVKSIQVNGVDVTDSTIDVKPEQSTMRIVLTDRPTALNGAVEARDSSVGHDVLVFTDDETKWKWPSRFVKVARTDEQGRFSIRGLPAGERYLVAAFDYFEVGEEQDPQFLERIRRSATSVMLSEGASQTIQLKVISR